MEKKRKILKQGLLELGIEPAEALLGHFEVYLDELKKWNRVYNITALTDDHDIIVKHFLDSLLYLKAIPQGHLTLCDVGTGGGFPGMPIAIIRPDIEVTLLEPSRKRIAFLRQMRRLLSLRNVEIIYSRAEEVEDRQFDVVVTRATFSAAELIKKAGHLIKPGGFFILSKGPKYEDELKDLKQGTKAEVIIGEVPEAGLSRNLLIISSI